MPTLLYSITVKVLLRLYKTLKVLIAAASKNWHALLVQKYKYWLDLVAEELPLVLDLVRIRTLVPGKQENWAPVICERWQGGGEAHAETSFANSVSLVEQTCVGAQGLGRERDMQQRYACCVNNSWVLYYYRIIVDMCVSLILTCQKKLQPIIELVRNTS